MIHQEPLPRIGRIVVTPSVLAHVPEEIMRRAVRSHRYAAVEGAPFETRHGYEGFRFRISTAAEGDTTWIRMESEEGEGGFPTVSTSMLSSIGHECTPGT